MTSIATTSINDGIGHLVIDAPPVNALSQPVRQGIVDGVARLSADPAVKAIAADPETFSNKTGAFGQRASAAQEEVARLYQTEGYLPIDTLVAKIRPATSAIGGWWTRCSARSGSSGPNRGS